MTGRPARWTPELKAAAQERICSEIAAGQRGLTRICKEDSGLPSERTVYEWLEEDASFAQRYAQAREQQADRYADAVIEIADTEEDPAKARNRIDARKWAAGKLRPKVYGDRLQLDADVNVTLTDEQLESRLAQLLGKTGAGGPAGGAGTPEGSA